MDVQPPTTPGATAVHTGTAYRKLIESYLKKRFAKFDIDVRVHVTFGRNGAGGARQHDILLYHAESNTALALECKFQGTSGSAEYKISFVVTEEIRKDRSVKSYVVCGGNGWSQKFRGWMDQQPELLFCEPNKSLRPSSKTQALDEVIIQHFNLPLTTVIKKGA
jgi:hypothetical protein